MNEITLAKPLTKAERALRYRCYMIYHEAIRIGQLARKPCGVCGTRRVEGHHADYTKPLEVKWLCKAHHIQEHQRLGWGLGGLVGGKKGGHMTGSSQAKIPGRMRKLGLMGGQSTASIPGHLARISILATHVKCHANRGIKKEGCDLCQAI